MVVKYGNRYGAKTKDVEAAIPSRASNSASATGNAKTTFELCRMKFVAK